MHSLGSWDIVVRPLDDVQGTSCEIADILFLLNSSSTHAHVANLSTATTMNISQARLARVTEVFQCSRYLWKGLSVSGTVKYDMSNVRTGPNQNLTRRLVLSDNMGILLNPVHSRVEDVITGSSIIDIHATRSSILVEINRAEISFITIALEELPTAECGPLLVSALRQICAQAKKCTDPSGARSHQEAKIGAQKREAPAEHEQWILTKQLEEVHSFISLCVEKLQKHRDKTGETMSIPYRPLTRTRSVLESSTLRGGSFRYRSVSVHAGEQTPEFVRSALVRTIGDMMDSVKSLKKVCKVMDPAIHGYEAMKRLLFDAEKRLLQAGEQYLTETERMNLGIGLTGPLVKRGKVAGDVGSTFQVASLDDVSMTFSPHA